MSPPECLCQLLGTATSPPRSCHTLKFFGYCLLRFKNNLYEYIDEARDTTQGLLKFYQKEFSELAMMSRQEVVPPVKRETGCSAVVRPTFSLGNNQTCTDCRARQKLCPNCKDKELTGRWLCGKSFATCQKGKTSCSVVVMMVAVCCC